MATWCFADTWVEYAEGNVTYFARHDPVRAVVFPVIALEAILTLALLAGWEFCRRKRMSRSPALHLLFLAICLPPCGIASVAILRAAPFDLAPLVQARWFWPAAFLVGAAPLAWVCLRPIRASRMVRSALLYSWPVLILVLAQAIRVSLLFPASAYTDGVLAARLSPHTGGIRVVWIVFDELSQAVAFGDRPSGLALPNLDRLKSESVYASAAESPATGTELAMPSLILGERVVEAHTAGPGELRIALQSRTDSVSWSSLPNIFDTARQLGVNTAAVGWFHPYGRVLNRSLTKCYWTAGALPPGIEEPFEPRPLIADMWDRVGMQIVALPLVGHLPGMWPGRHDLEAKLPRFAFLRERARDIVADPDIGLALIHLPIPHPPMIYDRARGTFTTEKKSYLDNVALVDRELGVLRRAMEDAGVWDRTALLVSADHGWRTGLWRKTAIWTAEDEGVSHMDTMGVPFLVRLPGQTSGVAYSKPFNTLLTRRLITGILRREVVDAGAVAALIEAAKSR